VRAKLFRIGQYARWYRCRRAAAWIFAANRPAFTAIVIPSCRGEGVMVEIELVLDLADSPG
jgi:hypothetical protein